MKWSEVWTWSREKITWEKAKPLGMHSTNGSVKGIPINVVNVTKFLRSLVWLPYVGGCQSTAYIPYDAIQKTSGILRRIAMRGYNFMLYPRFRQGASLSLPFRPRSRPFPLPSPFPVCPSPSLSQGVWGWASRGWKSSSSIISPEICLKYNMRSGAFWCTLATNLWLSSFHFCEQNFLSAPRGPWQTVAP